MGEDTAGDVDVRDLLNAQTGKMEWPELQRHFAKGILIVVSSGLDLVEVAAKIIEDDKDSIESWANAGQVSRALDDDAKRWEKEKPLFWAVVAAPWVVIQQIESKPDSSSLH